jgi:hypothetical protein
VRQRDRLALDERLSGEGLVAVVGRSGEKPIEIDQPVLECVHELVGERVAPELGGEPVRQDHSFGPRIVVGSAACSARRSA